MNGKDSRNDFLSGNTGGFFRMNRNQQNPGGFLGLNRTYQHNLSDDQVQPLMTPRLLVGGDCSVGLREVSERDSPRGFSMTFGKEKVDVARGFVGYGNGNGDENSSDEDEHSMDEGNGRGNEGATAKQEAHWRRMKWTNGIVRFLIQVVASVGDDGCLEGGGSSDGGKRKCGIIRKGKWKTVSEVLIAKGFRVSPQQCEDKFNDLNKRYKKLNDILRRGNPCAVVENPALLDKMVNLPAKAKEDVKKLLSSKHLFYKEMCAYHNGQKIPECSDTEMLAHSVQPVAEQVRKGSYSPSPAAKSTKDKKDDPHFVGQSSKDNHVSEDEPADKNDDSEDDTSDDDDGNHDLNVRSGYCGLAEFQAEIAAIFDDPRRSQLERKEWIRKRMLQLHEERIGIQVEAVDIGKRCLEWRRYCSKKEVELETSRLEIQRLIIENERKALELKQKEMEVEFKRGEAALTLAPFNLDVMGGKEQIDVGRKQ